MTLTFNSLVERIKFHKARIKNELEVVEHNRFNKTACPGKYFPINRVREVANKPDDDITKSINILKEKGIINSPDYWNQNAVKGKVINGEYAAILIKRVAAFLMKELQ